MTISTLVPRGGKVRAGLLIVLVFAALAVFGPMIARFDPSQTSFEMLEPPSARHWLGTTQTGQDVFAQFMTGARTSLLVGLLAGVVSQVVSVAVGLLGGYLRGVADDLLYILTAVFLGLACLGVTQLQASGVAQSELVLTESSARDGQVALGEHFPAGAGSPVQVITAQEDLEETAEQLLAQDGIDAVTVASADSPSGSAEVTPEGIRPAGPPGAPVPEPTAVDGQVLLQGTLTEAPDSAAAEETVRVLRADLAADGPAALVGGVTATAIDTNDASVHDRALIIPIVLAVILVILMLLLRAILAPVLLIATTVLSFGTAMGISALLFDHVLGFPGADPAVPLFGFVFLVALGIDYNIFLMTRVREEALRHGTADGVVRGLAVTGGVITSAGLVLAATFAALGVIPILFLAQLAVIVALGVLLDTFVVRTLLVPALVLDLGKVVWWPSRLWREGAR